jgi:hypothetical protein
MKGEPKPPRNQDQEQPPRKGETIESTVPEGEARIESAAVRFPRRKRTSASPVIDGPTAFSREKETSMSIRHAFSAIAAGVVISATAFAQTSAQTPPQTTPTQPTAQSGTQPETPITLVGCIQREADYRREQDKGRGGAVGTGAGAGNEFVLINASMATPDTPASSSAEPCAPGGKGEAYELTGNRERDLERFVGRRIEITGMLKKHETAGTTGTGASKPTGGFDPMGKDLLLPEVNVTSFKEVAASRPPAEAAAQPETPAEPRTPAEPERRPTGAAAVPNELPQTASQFPLAGLIGLLSLGAAFGVRSLRGC